MPFRKPDATEPIDPDAPPAKPPAMNKAERGLLIQSLADGWNVPAET